MLRCLYGASGSMMHSCEHALPTGCFYHHTCSSQENRLLYFNLEYMLFKPVPSISPGKRLVRSLPVLHCCSCSIWWHCVAWSPISLFVISCFLHWSLDCSSR